MGNDVTTSLPTANACPRAFQAATGSTYCKAIVANRKLPVASLAAVGAETRAGEKLLLPRPED